MWLILYKSLPLFIENYPLFIENFEPPPYRKLKPLISAFIENSIFGNNRDPCPGSCTTRFTKKIEKLCIINEIMYRVSFLTGAPLKFTSMGKS